MSRKPITTYAGGKGPRQCIWESIRRLKGVMATPFTEDEIWRSMDRDQRNQVEMGAIRDYRRALVAAGILVEVDPAKARRVPATYDLVKDEGLEAPRLRKDGSRVTQGLAQEQMWRTLRIYKVDLNSHELAAHASTEQVPVDEVAARDYLKVLSGAGYLDCTTEAKPGKRARYKLKPARNTGPRPPMVCRTKVVYDPNEDQVVWAARVTDEDAIHGK